MARPLRQDNGWSMVTITSDSWRTSYVLPPVGRSHLEKILLLCFLCTCLYSTSCANPDVYKMQNWTKLNHPQDVNNENSWKFHPLGISKRRIDQFLEGSKWVWLSARFCGWVTLACFEGNCSRIFFNNSLPSLEATPDARELFGKLRTAKVVQKKNSWSQAHVLDISLHLSAFKIFQAAIKPMNCLLHPTQNRGSTNHMMQNKSN